MNILYIGLDNPLQIVAKGIPTDELALDLGGDCTIKKGENNAYFAFPMKPNSNAVLKISHKGKVIGEHIFRIKRIPDPDAHLLTDDRNSQGGSIAVAKFRLTTALRVEMESFNYDIAIKIQSFNFTKVSRSKDIVSFTNQGAIFNKDVLRIIQTAQIGDTFYFEEVKALCPGDLVGRTINSLFFTMK